MKFKSFYIINSKNPIVGTYIFQVWQNRFWYFGVDSGNIGYVGSN